MRYILRILPSLLLLSYLQHLSVFEYIAQLRSPIVIKLSIGAVDVIEEEATTKILAQREYILSKYPGFSMNIDRVGPLNMSRGRPRLISWKVRIAMRTMDNTTSATD